MKISAVIGEFERIQAQYGDVEAQLQNSPSLGEMIVGYPSFFIVAEEYEEEVICNIRTWPY